MQRMLLSAKSSGHRSLRLVVELQHSVYCGSMPLPFVGRLRSHLLAARPLLYGFGFAAVVVTGYVWLKRRKFPQALLKLHIQCL